MGFMFYCFFMDSDVFSFLITSYTPTSVCVCLCLCLCLCLCRCGCLCHACVNFLSLRCSCLASCKGSGQPPNGSIRSLPSFLGWLLTVLYQP
ncbi:hypothetical protein BDW60DRAFT_195213 [Aspergillus nidulans var. acristatus]